MWLLAILFLIEWYFIREFICSQIVKKTTSDAFPNMLCILLLVHLLYMNGTVQDSGICDSTVNGWFYHSFLLSHWYYVDGLVQERRNSSALTMELHFSCTNPSMCARSRWMSHTVDISVANPMNETFECAISYINNFLIITSCPSLKPVHSHGSFYHVICPDKWH